MFFPTAKGLTKILLIVLCVVGPLLTIASACVTVIVCRRYRADGAKKSQLSADGGLPSADDTSDGPLSFQRFDGSPAAKRYSIVSGLPLQQGVSVRRHSHHGASSQRQYLYQDPNSVSVTTSSSRRTSFSQHTRYSAVPAANAAAVVGETNLGGGPHVGTDFGGEVGGGGRNAANSSGYGSPSSSYRYAGRPSVTSMSGSGGPGPGGRSSTGRTSSHQRGTSNRSTAAGEGKQQSVSAVVWLFEHPVLKRSNTHDSYSETCTVEKLKFAPLTS